MEPNGKALSLLPNQSWRSEGTKFETTFEFDRQRGRKGGILLVAKLPEAKGDARQHAENIVKVNAHYVICIRSGFIEPQPPLRR